MRIKTQSGQALVEFVMLLPIFIFMILALIDFGKIFYFKNNLENQMNDIILAYENFKTEEELSNQFNLKKDAISLKVKTDSEYVTFQLFKQIDIVTPGLNLILKSPYQIITERVIYRES